MVTISLLLLFLAAIQRRLGITIRIPFADISPTRLTAMAGLVAILEILIVAAGVVLLRQ